MGALSLDTDATAVSPLLAGRAKGMMALHKTHAHTGYIIEQVQGLI